jgi:FkbM family methyltransferase
MRNDCLNLQLIKTEQTGLLPSFLRALRDDFGLTTFVETGTFRGDTTAVAAGIFESVHSFELSPELHANALKRFSSKANVHLHHGDSAELLPGILASGLREKILFWLDGHFSGGPTAQGKVNTPILDEIRAIAAAGIKDCIVLVDDLRCFQKSGPGTPLSLTGYPTIWELREALRAIFPKLCFAHYGDVALAFSADDGPTLSPVLQGCTVSRLFDSLPADFAAPPVEELFQAEQLIAHAADAELEAIVALASAYPSGEKHGLGGHYHLWAGLALNQAGKLAEARKCFTRALELNCDHWRVRCYLAAALGELGEMGEAFMELNEARLAAPGQPLVTAIEQTLIQAKVRQGTAGSARGAAGRITSQSADPEANGEKSVLRRFIKPEAVVFDVGAHAGHWTDAVLAHCPSARVHLFEPLPTQAQALRERFAEGIARGQLSVEACALGEYDESREFHHYTGSPAWSGLHRRRSVESEARVQPPESINVRVITLDEYCRSAGVSRISFLKIDVEGGELAVLRGAQQLLRRGDIDFLQFEYGGTYRDSGVTLKEVFGFLRGLGYLVFRITAAGVEHCPDFSPAMEDYSYANFLAVHPRFRATLLESKPAMLDLAALSAEHGLQPRGVIHIGAHEGKEYERYQAMGFGKILFIEANPAVFTRLKAKLDGKHGVVLANCAISDRAGTAKLRVTSMDQSSSLLPLKLHSRIYPDIVETQQLEVRTITLDALLVELALDAADFNFLNIDIQGAELLALRGAEKTLRHIEAINTEVNLAELYEGCARLEEVDLHLKRRSFTRVAMVTPFHPSWGDAFYVRSVEAGGLITMSSLGKNGRFANQVFQYAFLKCHAQKHGLRVETPAWIGQKLFGFDDPAISRRLPEFRERSNQLADALVPNAARPIQNVDFWGFFQYNTRYYAPQRDYFRSLFRPTPQVLAKVAPMLDNLRSRGKTIVGLHLRRGDYGYEHFFVAPSAWYLEWLRSLWPTLEEPVLFIASDEPAKVLADFAEFNPITAKDLGPALPGADFYPDFFLLSQCDALAISNSSFSFAASMLNEQCSIFARPHLPTQRMIPFNPWNSETLLRDAKVGQASSPSLPSTKGLPAPAVQPVVSKDRLEDSPTFSFVTIVLNGMPFLEFALRAVYEFAHEIIIVEGAVKSCRFAAKPDGSSTDGTVECIRNFPDPQKKIRLIQGAWPEKCEMQNAALEHVTGDYVWLMDADEIYRRADLEKVRGLLRKDGSIMQINLIPDNFWKGFDHIFVSPKFLEPAAHYRRIFKFVPGARFTSHRPPTMVHPGSKRSTEQMNCIPGDVTRAMGIVPFHYSYVVESQVAQKVELYNRYGWGKQWKLDLNEWMRECWQKWTPENRAGIESRYPVWTGGGDSRTEPFSGEHPEVMREFIQRWREQKPAEAHALAVIGQAGFLRRTLELDAPLQKRRVEMERHLLAGTPFWNNHVGLAFLAHRLRPASYLEIGCRTGGSFVQVLSAESLKEATAVDLWAGIYSDLPNTKEFAAGQIDQCLKATKKICRVELRQGNSHVELKKLRTEGRCFDLINVDGDHTDEGAMQDLEDAFTLLSHRGAILFDDIIHPGFPTLLGVVKNFSARHPELRLVLNTTQDNGVAIFLRGVSVEELLRDEPLGDLSSETQERAQTPQPPRRLKIAGEVATKADLTQIDSNSAFAQAIRKLFAEIRPTRIIETGTYLGTGTTKVIAEAIRDLQLKDVTFHSIEVKPQHFEAAKRNLAKSGLSDVVQLHHGLSVPRLLLPTLQQIEEQTVRSVEFDDLFVDHQEQERALLYFKETDFSSVPEDLLGQCLRQVENRPDFVLLDSAGHMGHLEFNYLLDQLKGPCHIALDDIHHIKHHRSFRQMQTDPRFEMLVSSREKFGFCIAKFTPAAVGGVDETVQRLLWVRTDAIGDAALASSMLPHIRAKYPAAKIAVLCREHLAEFYMACPHVETILCFDWQKASQDETYRRSIVAEIAGYQPELVLNSTYSREPLTEMLALAFPAERFVGMEGNLSNISAGAKQRFDSKYTQLIASPGAQKLELERHRDFLTGLGINSEKLEPQVWTTPDDEAVAAAYFDQEKLDPTRTIALFPGAQNDRRIYPQYAEALKSLADFRILIFGDEKASSLASQISDALPGRCLNLAGKTTLRETAALLRRCRIYVGAESAGAHFACALGVPNVVVLGGGHFGRFMPYSSLTSVACLPLDCFGCDWRCAYAKPHCVKDVAPEVITEAIRDTLAKKSDKTRLFVQGDSLWKPEPGQPALGSLKGILPSGEYEIICVEKRGPGVAPTPACESATKAPPLVTAIVSTYNSERFLRGCLEDLEAQTIADRLEIIVVDSGSEEDERAIVQEFQQKYSNIVYLRTEREPLYAAWNRAISIARGKYLTNANADDRHRADAFEILARALDEHSLGIVYADSFITSVENETFATTKSRRVFDWPEFTLKELLTRSYFGPQPMWRRSIHDTVGLFDPALTIAGDYDFHIRVARKFGALRVPEVLGLYFEGGMESRNRRKCVEETRALLRQHRRAIAIEEIYPELNQPGLPPRRQAELLVDFAVTLATTWHPDVELAKELYRCAAGLCPEYVQELEVSAGRTSSLTTPASPTPARTGEITLPPSSGPRVSFCIITNGKRMQKLRAELDSIRALKIPEYEIIVAGDAPAGLGADVVVIPLAEAAHSGKTSVLRNAAMGRASFEHLVIADDDMLFHGNFYEGLKHFGEEYDVQCVRMLNPDGSRFWDWATVDGPRGQQLLDYGEVEPFLYVTSGLFVMKRAVAERVKWNESLGYYQAEDVDFSRRLQQAGLSIRHNPHSTATHNDARYTRDGLVIVRIEGALALAKQDYEAGRISIARHRLERALRLWPWAKSEILKFAAKCSDGPVIESLANQPAQPNSLPPEPLFELKVPVRWAGPFFGEGDEAGRAATLVEPLAKRIWLGIHHHGVPWVERAVESLPEEQRELLFSLADRFPAMLGGVGISQSVPENFAKLPGAVWNVGFVPLVLKQISPEQAACCREMDEVWVAEPPQAEAFARCGIPADKLRVIRGADEVFARLHEIEARLLRGSLEIESERDRQDACPTLVAWEGSFLDLGSLSHVNRAITAELSKKAGVEVTCIGRNAVPKELAAMDELQAMARRLESHPSANTQVTVRHAWPPDWTRPKQGAWVLIQPWEFGALPVEWMQPLARVDEVWVPSEFVRRCYIESGVDARKVHVVPNGIDPQRFQPQARPRFLATQKKFKFLFVGGTIHRKGPDVLLKAFLDNFTATDDVCLVIKDFGGQSVYSGQTFGAQIRAAQAKPNTPEILYLTDDLSAEDMPGLYTACDCLVHPYRGEGFGLPVLEAMACGLPVVVTAGGSTDDFATDELAYRIPAQRKEFGNSVSGMKLVKPGWLMEPDAVALGERLKWIVANQAEAKAKGRTAGERVRTQWTWDRAASVAAVRLREIASKQGTRPASKKTTKPIQLPACAKLGHLASARQLFQVGKLLPAWEATVAALQARPFHPEAFVLLAEIAQASGDVKRARALAEHARSIAPAWKPAKQFLKSPPRRGSATAVLPELPFTLAPSSSSSRIPRLTVCLIAKNEERFIGQCLESIRPIAEQIIVVDTGSTDWTTSIAGRFGAEIYKFKWCDDFSAARNAALEKATGDWVLMLDADEKLPAEQQQKLLALLRDPKAIAYRLPMIDVGQEEAGVSHVPRLFRNAPGLFYVGRVHEQIFSSVEVRRTEWGLENRFGDSTLLHYGYTKEMVRSRDKVSRNLRLLEMAVEEMPGEPNLLMNLGLELMRTGRVHEGLENYEAAFEAMGGLPKAQVVPELRESLLTQFATHLAAAKRFADVVRVLTSPVAKSGGLTASMHWLLGLACVELKQFSEGAAQMRDCLAKRECPALTPVLKDIRKGAPHHALAVCLVSMKQAEAARRAFESALKEEPGNRRVRFDFARFLANSGEAVEALKWAHQLMAEDPSDVAVWQFGGQVALGSPDFIEFARDWTGEAVKSHPDAPALVEQRATALLLSGELEEALSLWRVLGEGHPTAAAARLICEAGSGAALSSVGAGSSMAKVNEAFVLWYRRLLQFNATKAVLSVNGRVEELRSFVPAAANVIGAAVAAAA